MKNFDEHYFLDYVTYEVNPHDRSQILVNVWLMCDTDMDKTVHIIVSNKHATRYSYVIEDTNQPYDEDDLDNVLKNLGFELSRKWLAENGLPAYFGADFDWE